MRRLDSITGTNVSKLQEMKDRSLACCSSWGRKESDMTDRLNNSNRLSSYPGHLQQLPSP